MGHDVEQSEPIVLEEIVLVPLKSELLPELVNQIHVDLYSAGDGKVAKEGRVHETLKGLVGSCRITEVTDQQIAVGALEGLHQIPLLIWGEVGQETGGIPFVEDTQVPQALLKSAGQLPSTAL